ncbi:flavodoxin domain-containing protein [Planomonospora sp. ID82291]|uniref:flavodoxin family protein n=1 Tax=Planomonospora sp. ID82291 TaxID=2738136 RepID=UPI0018C382C3|nr:flavodoxin domain-containing protein [Planomonospora sp. ID82291]MBG0816540.1 flavodoxin [Planomonospora sp. ID82291]
MRALVVFESMFGNTQTIAEAIAQGLTTRMDVELAEVADAPTAIADDVDLIVVGGPTHAFSMSRPATRQSAAEQAPDGLVSKGQGLREWLASLDGRPAHTTAAAFDTRVKNPWVPGSAARGAAKHLRRHGFPIVTEAHSFYVAGTSGPLLEGEAERARNWGAELGAALLAATR